jgi:hypothetical protein
MACDIQILTASGTSLPQQTKANTVTIGGTAQDCAQVNVTISCGGESASKTASVGFNGSWAVLFDTSALGCTCGQNFSVYAYCVGNPDCFDEATFDLECTACPYVNDINFIVHLDLDPYPTPLCVNGRTRALVTLTAMGSPGAGKYVWDFDDGTPFEETTVPSVSHEFEFPDLSYNIEVTYSPAQAGCPQTSKVKTLLVPDCKDVPPPPPPKRPEGIIPETDVTPKKPAKRPEGIFPETDVTPKKKDDTGGGKLSCDALLVAAVSVFLAGGLAIAIGVCSKVWWVGIAGIAGAALGVALFFVWWAICGKISSCDVMQKMHGLLRMIVLLGLPLGLLGLGLQALGGMNLEPACWGAIAGYYGSIAWLKDRLETIMWDADCPPTATF